VQFRHRYYDPETGQFTTEDPIGFAGGGNLYAYAANNPVTYTDPFGLCPECTAQYIATMLFGPTWEERTNEVIQTLDARVQPLARAFVNLADMSGVQLAVYEGFRTFERQDRFYRQGVSRARAGQSYHNYGLAMDAVPIVEGRADWDSKKWDEVGRLGKALGFEWGGEFKGLVDKPHFQLRFGQTWQQLFIQQVVYPPFTASTALLR
jgi:peptidoglycan L-alanyl-D-glutamate endopeptidase CwlK